MAASPVRKAEASAQAQAAAEAGAAAQADAQGLAGYRHGRVPRDVRRRQLLDLGEALFAERGYSGTSMDELARSAGVTKPVIYELIGNKEQLFRACMNKVADDLAHDISEAVRSATGPRHRILAGMGAWFSFIGQHRDIWEGLLSGEDSPSSREVTAIRLRQARLVADLLAAESAALGIEGTPLLFEALAHLINGACESLGAWWRDHDDVSAAVLAELCTDVVYPGLEALRSSRTGDGGAWQRHASVMSTRRSPTATASGRTRTAAKPS